MDPISLHSAPLGLGRSHSGLITTAIVSIPSIRKDAKNPFVAFSSLFLRKGNKKEKSTYFYKLCRQFRKVERPNM